MTEDTYDLLLEDEDEPKSPGRPAKSQSNTVLVLIVIIVFLAVVIVGYFVVREVLGEREPQTMSEAAIVSLERQIEEDPSNAELYFQLADAYYRIKEYEDAMEVLSRLESMGSTGYTLAQAKYGIARIEQARGDADAAFENYFDSLEAYETADARYGLASLYVSLEQWDDAIASFEQYLALAPTDAGAMVDLASAYEQKGDTVKALEIYKRASTFLPGDAELEAAIARLEGGQ